MSYRTFDQNLVSGNKINPLSDIANLGIVTTGNVVFVKDPGDDDYRRVKEDVGNENLFDTIQAAIDSPKIRDGKNDYIIVCPKDDNTAYVPSGTPAGVVLDKDN